MSVALKPDALPVGLGSGCFACGPTQQEDLSDCWSGHCGDISCFHAKDFSARRIKSGITPF